MKRCILGLCLFLFSSVTFAQTTTLSREELRTGDQVPDFVKEWSLQVVKGGNDFKAVQGRYKAFGFRVGRMDLSEFADVPRVGSDPLQSNNETFSFRSSKSGDDEGSDNCTTICHLPPGNPENEHTLCVGGEAVEAHLAHGDHVGACEGDDPGDDDPPGDMDCDNDNNDNDDEDSDDPGDEDPGDDDPSTTNTFRTLGWKDVDDRVESAEAFVYLPTLFGRDNCLLDSGVTGKNIKVGCRFSAFAGLGVVRVKEQLIVQNNNNGLFFRQDERHDIRPTVSAGAEYITPFRLTMSAGYHSEAKWAVGVGYGFVWQGKRKTNLRW